ncbi:MAG TPA: DUF4974 domain-containing protein [Candidatus Moranbacteria bacterium]|nr:DUF4974 domain-containing protein [Candidatus Moranbacteria bacterium]
MRYKNFKTEDFIKDEFFIRWVTQEDQEVSKFWTDWLANHPEKKTQVNEAKAFILDLDFQEEALSEKDQQALLNSIHQEIGTANQAKSILPKLLKIAVAVAIFGVLFFAAARFFNQSPSNFSTLYSEIKNITLADGSTVVLNANSKLKVSKDWTKEKTREVWLEGEAFFSVNPKPKKGANKFVVHTSDLDIEVLGTKFNVKSRKQKTTVVLTEGKIQLSPTQQDASSNKIEMIPDKRIVYHAQTKSLKETDVNTKLFTSWVDGVIVCEEKPLSELIEIIEETHGIDVIVENQDLLNIKLGGTLPNDNPDTFIKSIQILLAKKKIKVVRKGASKIIIR